MNNRTIPYVILKFEPEKTFEKDFADFVEQVLEWQKKKDEFKRKNEKSTAPLFFEKLD